MIFHCLSNICLLFLPDIFTYPEILPQFGWETVHGLLSHRSMPKCESVAATNQKFITWYSFAMRLHLPVESRRVGEEKLQAEGMSREQLSARFHSLATCCRFTQRPPAPPPTCPPSLPAWLLPSRTPVNSGHLPSRSRRCFKGWDSIFLELFPSLQTQILLSCHVW